MRSPASAWSPPARFDEYELVRPLGRGAMGQVYLARDTYLERTVAIKFVSPTSEHAGRERFLIEARALARLQHPNVVTVHRVGEIDGHPYLVSEYVRGQRLDAIERPVPWRRVLEIAIGVARGLAAAHRSGVLHRDVKPENTIVADGGEVKVLDFGLAKLYPLAPGAARVRRSGGGSLDVERSGRREVSLLDRSRDRVALDKTTASGQRPGPVLEPTDPGDVGVAITDRPTDHDLGQVETDPDALKNVSANASPTVTQDGAVIGTPLYMAPELWNGESATTCSDVYAVGALLYDLLTGEPPHARSADLNQLAYQVTTIGATPVSAAAPSVDARLARLVDRCLAREPAERPADGDALRAELEAVQAAELGGTLPEGNPYRGLRPFEAEHRAVFFGRSAEVRAVIDRLRSDSMVVVAGSSGLGKSSLCRAGVLPGIRQNTTGAPPVEIAAMVPGRRPLAALSQALAHAIGGSERDLAQVCHARPEDLPHEVRRRVGREAQLVLFVDQLEELATQSEPAEAADFARALRHLLGSPNVRVLATIRGDLITQTAAVGDLGELLGRSLFLLRPIGQDGLREAVVGPALAKGVRFESDAMVDELVSAAERSNSGLPLLQFTLAELWEKRDASTGIIPSSALAELGGVEACLARHADTVMAGLVRGVRAAARGILLRLVSAEGTRRRASEADLVHGDDERQALEALVNGRLVAVLEGDQGAELEVAHEALVTGWGALRGWVADGAETRKARERLEAAAAEWQQHDRAGELLWGARLLRALPALDEAELGADARDYLRASRGAARRRRWLRAGAAALIPLAVAATWGGFRLQEASRRDESVSQRLRDAQVRVDRASARRREVETAREEAFTAWERRDGATAEARWAVAQAAMHEVDRDLGEAGKEIEQGLMVDPARDDAHDLLADVLFLRAVVADEQGHGDRRDELLARLSLHDRGGARAARFAEPARVEITTDPPGARVRVEVVERRDDGRRVAVARGSLGATPVRTELTPGAYLLTFEAEGRAPVTYPVLLGRGEALTDDIKLPPADRIPVGFVFVPAGRFLIGSSAEALRREFLSTVALHPSRTGAFLIARYETTYAEWIEYLEALDPAERTLRTPAVAAMSGAHGGIGLLRSPAGTWSLAIRPTVQEYRAQAGEKVRYLGRDHRADQDWQRFPVSGISAEDAEAYTGWLRRTGRVPGARLCTEHEWERAARGADDREFPSGDLLQPDDANFDETYGRNPVAFGPDEVGSHPGSTSPFGLQDMTGNVWEWVRVSLSNEMHAVRGGAFYFGQMTGRVTNRWLPETSARDFMLGVRVCADPP